MPSKFVKSALGASQRACMKREERGIYAALLFVFTGRQEVWSLLLLREVKRHKCRAPAASSRFHAYALAASLGVLLALGALTSARAEAMLELFQMSWSDLTAKMPELAEAGYTSLWLPQPAKGGSVWSVGYDLFDPFDLGDKNQQGTVATKYGTKAQLLQMVETAHRFGLRVYFDNVMNHRAGIVPGYDVYTPTNILPGLRPQDFHLQSTASGNRNWPDVQDWSNQNDVQNEPINGLCDLANEPGGINYNFGPTLFSQASKPFFVRQPNNPEYYMDTNTVLLGCWSAGSSPGFSWPAGSWHGFNGTNGQPVAERVEDYLTRAALWTLYTTKCDGFRLDAVKHTPSPFFGDSSSSWRGYVGGIQAMFDYTHGYGTNVLGNGYVEGDDMRNSCFDTEAPRNDALLFGEHLGPPPSYSEYLNTGMRLLNSPLRDTLNGALSGGGNLPIGLEQGGYTPGGGFPPSQGVEFAEDQDHILCCPTHREMQNAYYFMHEGLPMIYSDNFNWAGNPSDPNTFPQVPMTDYLGQYGDTTMPETVFLHQNLARGGTRSRWSDAHIVAFERYDYRDVSGDAYNNPDATVVLFAMNATFNNPSGDVLFDDGVGRTSDNYYTCYNGSPSKGVGLVVGFPPGSVLSQMAGSSPGGGNARTCPKLLVHGATQSLQAAQQSATNSDPTQRLIYVGNQTLAQGGGAIELLIPAGGWVMYAYQGPEPSRANTLTNAITFKQGGSPVPMVLAYRHDGVNGDPNFSPVYPFKVRGSVDVNGNPLLYPGEGHLSSLTNAYGVQSLTNSYAIQVPIVTNAALDITVRSDASAANVLVKMDGGLDLNSQMGYAPATGFDRRDNRPGCVTDVYLGYEQAAPQLLYGPEKFAAPLVSRNNLASAGAETYSYTVGGTNSLLLGSGNGNALNAQTASWVYHAPAAPTTVATSASLPVAPLTQMVPTNPLPNQPVDVWVKVGYKSQIDLCSIYYTTDGSNPEGAFGLGKGTTQVVQANWVNADSVDSNIDWWKGTIPGVGANIQVRYKVALFKHQNTSPITDADNSKLYGLAQYGITNFNPTTATVWLHNDLNTNNTATGLKTGFHVVRARAFLPRAGKSAVYSTYLQTFYYDGGLPGGVIAYPAADGAAITGSTYNVVVRADSTVSEVDYTISDVNGTQTGVALPVSPDATLSARYTNYAQEFRFNYNPVAGSGNATISVQLKTLSTSVYSSRYTTLTRTVQAAAPVKVVKFANPPADGAVLILNSNDTCLVQACFSTTLPANVNSFSLYLNNVLQPKSGYFLRASGAVPGCPGMNSFLCYCSPTSGSNTLQILYTNGLTLSDSHTVAVARIGDPADSDGDGVPDWMEILAGTNPYDANSFLRITGLMPGNPVQLLWSSVPGKSYQVLGTTNLACPMAPLPRAQVTADPNASLTHWFDASPDATNRFYRIQVQ